ncbi:MAG: hypothetical protein RL637_882 [Pseudomonadota bacterium]
MMSSATHSVKQLLSYIDASPSPCHVIESTIDLLHQAHFQPLSETEQWRLNPGGRYYVTREDSSIIAFIVGQDLIKQGCRLLVAHTDSPGLRIKPRLAKTTDQLQRLAVEVYGGAMLATFADRDLSLAGCVAYKTKTGAIQRRLVKWSQPLLRLPTLAIHLNRAVNEEGLKFQKQQELNLILSATETQLADNYFYQLLAQQTDLSPEQILTWDLAVYDTQKGSFWGANQEFYANSQLDNLASCHAGLMALLNQKSLNSGQTLICGFFDHEEVGSESYQGAASDFLSSVLQRLIAATSDDPQAYPRMMANSWLISADMAHAYHPNFSRAYDSEHKILINQGVVIKINANQRYSSNAFSSAFFIDLCQQANVPYQFYAHVNDSPCGSTLGPILATQLGIRSVDIGNPMWAMHSVRESAGVLDHHYLINVLCQFFAYT